MARLYVCPLATREIRDDDLRAMGAVREVYPVIRDLAPGRVRRPAVHIIATGSRRGEPLHPWTICEVEEGDWTAVEAEPACIWLDEAGLDATLSGGTRRALRQLTGATNAEVAGPAREVAATLRRKHYPEATFDRGFPTRSREG